MSSVHKKTFGEEINSWFATDEEQALPEDGDDVTGDEELGKVAIQINNNECKLFVK